MATEWAYRCKGCGRQSDWQPTPSLADVPEEFQNHAPEPGDYAGVGWDLLTRESVDA